MSETDKLKLLFNNLNLWTRWTRQNTIKKTSADDFQPIMNVAGIYLEIIEGT